MNPIDTYRIGHGPIAALGAYKRLYDAGYTHPFCLREARKMMRRSSDRWRRNWQAEWHNCGTAVRGWTRRGVTHKALRAKAKQDQR